jgi:hypothetical protein
LAAQLLVLTATAGVGAYWWLSVVPSARRTLAKEKRAGPLNEYLVNLQQNPNKQLERWFYTDWLQQLQRRQGLTQSAAAKRTAAAAEASRAADLHVAGEPEQQQQQQQQQTTLGSDNNSGPNLSSSLQEPQLHAGAVDDDKQPSFWSLDNPILATATILGTLAAISSILN